jgi:hypothetical protein
MLERLAKDKHSGLIRKFVNYSCKKLKTLIPGAIVINLFTAVIMNFHDKLEYLPLADLSSLV